MKNVGQTVIYYAYNDSTGAYVTGDASNHVLRLMQDGTKVTPAASPSEVDSTNLPGAYSEAIAATENIGNLMMLGGKSSTSNVQLIPTRWSNDPIPGIVRSGVAQAGGSSTITLDASASATNSLYNGSRIAIVAGTGAGQGDRIITGYVGSTQVATVDSAWTTNPDSTSVFVIIPAAANVRSWLATLVTAVTGGIPDINVKNIGNATAAINANNFLKVSLNDILATTLTETSGQLAAGFKKWFNVASPTSTMNEVTLVDTVTTLTNPPTGMATTTQVAAVTTAISALLPTALTSNGNLKVALQEILTTAITESATGRIAAAWKAAWNVASSTWTSADVNQTGDTYGVVTNGTYGNSAIETLISGLNNITAASVWSVGTRLLTAGTNIVLAKGTGITGFNDIAATAIVSSGAITTSGGKVSEVALVDTLTTYTGNTPQTGDAYAEVAAGVSVGSGGITSASFANNSITGNSLASTALAAIWGYVVEAHGSYTAKQAMSIMLSLLAGESSGGGLTFLTPDGSTTRAVAVVDGSNNRTSMTLTPSS